LFRDYPRLRLASQSSRIHAFRLMIRVKPTSILDEDLSRPLAYCDLSSSDSSAISPSNFIEPI
jgi:hypothetical protein